MDLAHDGAEDLAGGVAVEVHPLRDLIARPDGGDIVHGEAAEVTVLVVGGGAGLAGHGGAAEVGLGAGAVGNGGLHHAAEVGGGVGLDGVVLLGGIVKDHIALLVGDHGIGAGDGHKTFVGEGGIGLRHFPDGDALRQLAQRQRSVGVVGVALGAVVGNETGDAETLREVFPAGGQSQMVQKLRGNGVFGVDEGGAHGDDAGIAAGVAGVPAGARQLDAGRVVNAGVLVDEAGVQRGGVDRQRLEGASRGPFGFRGQIQAQIDLLLAHIAGQSHDVAGAGVHDDDGRAELLAGTAVGLGQAAEVLIVAVNDLLDAHVHAGVDVVAAGADELVGLCFGDAAGGGQIPDGIVDDGLFVPGVDGAVLIVVAGGGLDLVGDGFLILFVGDVVLLVHLAQNGVGADAVVFGVDVQIVLGGVVGDADEAGTFGQIQLPHILAEIGPGGGAHAVAALTQIDLV